LYLYILWRVWVASLIIVGSGSLDSIYWILNTCNYTWLPLLQSCRSCNTQPITTLSNYHDHWTELTKNWTELNWTELLHSYYDRRSVGQSVLASKPFWGFWPDFLILSDTYGFVDMGRPLWREDGYVFYNCCCLRQRSHSQVRDPLGSWPPFTISELRLPQPGGPGPCIYIRQEEGKR
jgi:hypothetical protein